MHDMEVTLDLFDERVEQARSCVDIMEFDSYRDDIFGMPEQIVEDEIFTSFNVHFHKHGAFRRQAPEDIFYGRAVVLVVPPDSLFEMNSVCPKKGFVVDPRKRPS